MFDQMTDEQLDRIRSFAESDGWFVVWWTNHGTWLATHHGETKFSGDGAASYNDAYKQFLKAAFASIDPVIRLVCLMVQ